MTKQLKFDHKKTSDTYNSLVEIFRDAKLTIGEILVAYGNLGIALGTSIENKNETLAIEEIEKEYLRNPTPGLALILQGSEVVSWYKQHEQTIIKDD